jgi:hypothetical protein
LFEYHQATEDDLAVARCGDLNEFIWQSRCGDLNEFIWQSRAAARSPGLLALDLAY